MGLKKAEVYYTEHIPILFFIETWIMLKQEAFYITADTF